MNSKFSVTIPFIKTRLYHCRIGLRTMLHRSIRTPMRYHSVLGSEETVASGSPVLTSSSDFLSPSESLSYIRSIDRLLNWGSSFGSHCWGLSWTPTALLNNAHLSLGLDPSLVLFFFGAALRLVTLFFSLYGERAMSRMMIALPRLQEAQEIYNRLRSCPEVSALSLYKAALKFQQKRKEVFQKYKTSNLKCLAPVAAAPVFIVGWSNTTNYCAHLSQSGSPSSFLGPAALSVPDATLVFPFFCCALALLNFELSFSQFHRAHGWAAQLIWAARAGALVAIPIVSHFPCGVCIFFLGMNLVGLLQPLLLRSSRFRRVFGFPSAEDSCQVASSKCGALKITRVRYNEKDYTNGGP